VYWIIKDEDVNQFARQIITNREGAIDLTNFGLLQMLLEDTEESNSSSDEDFPF